MIHRHYDWLRRFRTRAFALFTAAEEDECVSETTSSPHESAARLEHARLLRECLDELPRRQRMVVYLRFYAGESLEGIAATARCSIGTVKSRLFHALKRLAKMQKIKQLRDGQEHNEPLP
jgi:RNA polymerase sigma factor (sigma-70 family)